jgi:endonuclease YncB( thermonuclease family)
LTAAVLAASLPVAFAAAQTATLCRVESVTPRNSLICVDDKGARRQVVLAYLSIPAGQQPYADRAAQVLRAQLVGREVNLRPVGRQGDGYVSALVYVGTHNFNNDFLRRGHAWLNHLQSPPSQWRRFEAAARDDRVGLWATAQPEHPIDWENSHRQALAVRGTLDRLAADEPAQERIKTTFVGSRTSKTYYPFMCAPWFELDDRDVVIFTSARGAQAAGYRAVDCKTRG